MRHFHSILSTLAVTLMAGIASPVFAADNFADSSQESAGMNCRLEFASASGRAEICTAADGRALVTLTWANREKPAAPTIVKAVFAAENEKLWRRIWVAGGNPVVQADNQLALRRDVYAYGAERIHPRVHAVIDFVVNFVPAGTSLEVFQRSFTDQLLDERNLTSAYNLICQELGKLRTAIFSLGKGDIKLDMTVGDNSSGCPGRCGPGCHQIYEWRSKQYTNECFVHDACTSMTGEWLGQCTGLFVTAALGYLLAPDCSQPAPPTQSQNQARAN